MKRELDPKPTPEEVEQAVMEMRAFKELCRRISKYGLQRFGQQVVGFKLHFPAGPSFETPIPPEYRYRGGSNSGGAG